MLNFRLNNTTIENIQASTGLDAKSLRQMDAISIDKSIEKRLGKTLRPAIEVGGINPRGSVYLMFGRIWTSKEINKRIASIRP